MDESELRLSLVDHLQPRDGGNAGLLLLIDEAHTLPLRLWEEIRLITNLVRDGQPRVRLVMAGGMALEERLANPKLDSLQQRIAARCYLQPMNRDETIHFVQEQLKRAGADPDQLFTAAALKAIHTATDGIPRLVNQVCDHALLLAALGGHKQLGADGIQEAWGDLQQLPVPVREPARPLASPSQSPQQSVVEFGQLDDSSEPGGSGQPGESASTAVTQVGPFRSQEGDAAIEKLDAIDDGLDALREEGAEFAVEPLPKEGEPDDFAPVDASATEVELIFHTAHDPFGGDWQEEEVIIDRYAMLEEARLRRFSSQEGRDIGAALYAASPPPKPKLARTPETELADRDSPEEQVSVAVTQLATDIAPFDPASDPLLPEEPVAASVTMAAEETQAPRRAGISLRDLAGDDRDIIVVQESPARSAARPPESPPKPREYRQLFSNLRKR
jgi:hypothetical protein